MTVFSNMCPSLAKLARLLQDLYQQRNDSQLCDNSEAFLKAESDMKRVHRLISRHRAACPQCKSNEQRGMMSEPGEVVPFNRVN
jgi:hypothetical protein